MWSQRHQAGDDAVHDRVGERLPGVGVAADTSCEPFRGGFDLETADGRGVRFDRFPCLLRRLLDEAVRVLRQALSDVLAVGIVDEVALQQPFEFVLQFRAFGEGDAVEGFRLMTDRVGHDLLRIVAEFLNLAGPFRDELVQ